MRKKSKTDRVDLRQKLTADFVAALQADWDEHGREIIETLRTRAPTKYAEIISRFGMPEPLPGPEDFSTAKSMHDIGLKLLLSVGLERATEDQIEAAIVANDKFIEQLERIAQGIEFNDNAQTIA
jgi:hypothetical protein